MPYYAIVREQRVLCALWLEDAAAAAEQALDEGDSIVEMPDQTYAAFAEMRGADYVDGVFTIDVPLIAIDPDDVAREVATETVKGDCSVYLAGRYSDATFSAMKQIAHVCAVKITSTSLTEVQKEPYRDRDDAVRSVIAWIEEVLAYCYEKVREIAQCANAEAVALVTWDFSQFDASDPQVTLASVDL